MTLQEGIAQATPNIVQEEQSAEVFLEEYTDKFQDTFFEALKQKGIQNYDRAINLLLECKQMEVADTAIDHELAKAYLSSKKFIPAQEYAAVALNHQPENYWYLDTFLKSLDGQGIPLEEMKTAIPFENESLKLNLATIYVDKKRYKKAQTILRSLSKTNEQTVLLQKIDEALTTKSKKTQIVKSTPPAQETEQEDPLGNLRATLANLNLEKKYGALLEQSLKATESYPLQPDFYYFLGLAYHKKGDNSKAVESLEEGLTYLFDNEALANDFYNTLGSAYRNLGNESKANEYLSKIKQGF